MKRKIQTKKAAFGAGCFWGVEAAFRKVKGAVDVCSGYMGGHVKKPSYKRVCSGMTGHVETIEITYDIDKVSYRELLEIFWSIHDPTQLNRQGSDIGEQYRSVIFYYDEEQRREAELSKKKQQEKCANKIMTAIEKAGVFWKAEEYHQRYLEKHEKNVC